MDVGRLQRLLDPGSVAFVGGQRALLAMRQSERLGYGGSMWLVNPTADRLGSHLTFPSLSALPVIPDAVFIAVGADTSIEVASAAAKLGVAGAVAYASGFSETGRTDRTDALLEAAGDMVLLGPNCHGFINAGSGAALWPDVAGVERCERGIAIVSQSGDIAINLTMQQRQIPISHVITLGNQANVTAADCIEVLAADPGVDAIGLYVEGVVDSVAFANAAVRAHHAKTPIVAIKAGITPVGEALVRSHTATLAGSKAAHDALFAACGITIVDTPEHLAGALALLAHGGRLPGTRMVSLSSSGGEAALVADLTGPLPVELPAFEPTTSQRLSALLGGDVAVANPLDYHTYIWGDRAALTAVFTAAFETTDVGLLLLDWPAEGTDDTDWWPTLEAFCDAVAATGCRGVLTTTLAENLPRRVARHLADHHIAAIPSLQPALGAIAAARPVEVHNTTHVAAPASIDRKRLDEGTAKGMLRAAGLPVPDGVATDPTAAAGVATDLGYPVVVKSLARVHRSEDGGVALHLETAAAVENAVAAMRHMGDSVLVERHVGGVVAEVLVGIAVDEPVGWTLTLGAGGVLTELIADTRTLLLPTTPHDVRNALSDLRIGVLLGGYRGAERADLEAVVDTVMRLTAVALERPAEIEVNPLLACSDGAWIVDVLMYDLEVRDG